MTNNINSDTTPQVLQTYTLLQIAAEAMFGQGHERDAATAGSGAKEVGTIDPGVLTKGNDHSSKMTTDQAQKFSEEWTVISHQPNTATGFSGTLFQYKGEDDASRGLTHDQFVVSFRSTEFIEDTARDNQETNTQELSEGGWAYGQIADMQTWWESVLGGKVELTGYSLAVVVSPGCDNPAVRTRLGSCVGRAVPIRRPVASTTRKRCA